MKKKMLAILLAAVMAVSPLGTVKSLAAGQTISEEDGNYDDIELKQYAVPGTNAVLSYAETAAEEVVIIWCNEDVTGNLKIPETIDGKKVAALRSRTIGNGGPFYEHQSLTGIELPETVRDMGHMTFVGCSGLKNVKLSDNITEIGIDAFFCCPFEEIRLPKKLKTIREGGLSECENLKKIEISKNVSKIEAGAFHGCDSLKDVYYEGSEADWKKIEIDNFCDFNEALLNATIHYNSSMSDITQQMFVDIKKSDYYYNAVLWAAGNEITAGVDETGTKFAPKDNATRGQVVTFLWRAAGCPEPTNMNNKFTDVSAKDFYYKPILWAVENGITSGVNREQTLFDPEANATRGEVLTFMWRAIGRPLPEDMNNKFTDVRPKDFYYTPVLWAVENGITSGVGAERFAPKNLITRADFVSFLYRKDQN